MRITKSIVINHFIAHWLVSSIARKVFAVEIVINGLPCFAAYWQVKCPPINDVIYNPK